MRTINDVLDQIRWDPRLLGARFFVRWLERNGNVREEPLAAFLARRDLPRHRVRALVCDGAVVWSREGIDELARVLDDAARTSPLELGALAFWNAGLLSASEDEPRTAVVDDLVALAGSGIAGVVEVDGAFVAAVRARLPGHAVFSVDSLAFVAPPPGERTWRVDALPLPGRRALLATGARAGCADVVVAVAHLTSNARGDRSTRRDEQREALARALPGVGPLVVMLDANHDGALPELEALGLVDVGAGPTFPRAAPARRLDRIYARGLGDVVDVRVHSAVASDHAAISCAFAGHDPMTGWARRRMPRSSETALAIVLPDDVAALADVIRRDHDDAFSRWPAHINVAFPFVPRDALTSVDEIVAPLARAFVEVEPFTLVLQHELGCFDHARSRTVFARPVD
ncbi:MAG TPA: RNA repair domain-containing protein, partial [Myxococcota bacterium]